VENFDVIQRTGQLLGELSTWFGSPLFYSQLGLVILAVMSAYLMAALICRWVPLFSLEPKEPVQQLLRNGLYKSRILLFPLLTIFMLSVAVDVSDRLWQQSAMIRVAHGLSVVAMLYQLIGRFVSNPLAKNVIKLVVIPISLLQVFGVLEPIISYLESQAIEIGNISVSAYGVIRVVIFGAILFWLGRLSNRVGQKVIRQQESLDVGTREIFAKIYQVALVLIVALLLLQVMGVNITALAVFGGALGVGIGFGLQSIASNFISGVILLLDRSLTLGDYVELEDGRKGHIVELNMRFTVLETFDGKEIMVPNERFISTSFTNWTHTNRKQRYAIELQVAYSTDLHALFPVLREVVTHHPQVLSGDDVPFEERPDAEIKGFGESGVDILIEFWMEGIDDGRNRVGGDLLLMIWDALKAHHVEIPFPQREVKIVTVGQDGN